MDHLTGWPIAKAIPDKEAMTVANAIFEKLILEQVAHLKFFFLTMVRSSPMTLWPMCVRSSILDSILPGPLHKLGQMVRWRNSISFYKPSSESYVRRTLQHGIRSWTRSCLCIGAALTYAPERYPIPYCTTGIHCWPVQKLIQCIEPCKSDSTLGKTIEQSWRLLFPLWLKCWRGCRLTRIDTTSTAEPPTSFK